MDASRFGAVKTVKQSWSQRNNKEVQTKAALAKLFCQTHGEKSGEWMEKSFKQPED